MRLFGQLADAVEEPSDKKGSRRATAEPPTEEPAAASRAPSFEELGEHVAGILKAAEESAEQIRADAREEAGEIVGKATLEAEEKHQTADREIQRTRQKAAGDEEEAHGRIAEAEGASKARLEEIQAEITRLEEERQRALGEVRELVSELREVLRDAPQRREAGGEPFTVRSVPDGPSHEEDEDTVVQGAPGEEDTVVESVRIRRR